MTSTTQTASDIAKDIARVFALQQENQWTVKASTVAQRREKLAKLKAAVEAERLAQQRIDEAAGAHAASKNEQLQSRDALCKALNEQAPGQLIARKGRHYIASGQLLREFDAPQSL